MTLDPAGLPALLLTHWGPPLITVLLGGALASALFPRWQNRAAQARSFAERRFAVMEEIAERFPPYVAAWRRLVQISGLERTRELSEAEAELKREFIDHRRTARDELFSALSRGRIYFSSDSREVIDGFMKWDDANSERRLHELPDYKEWQAWQSRVIDQLVQHERD